MDYVNSIWIPCQKRYKDISGDDVSGEVLRHRKIEILYVGDKRRHIQGATRNPSERRSGATSPYPDGCQILEHKKKDDRQVFRVRGGCS